MTWRNLAGVDEEVGKNLRQAHPVSIEHDGINRQVNDQLLVKRDEIGLADLGCALNKVVQQQQAFFQVLFFRC